MFNFQPEIEKEPSADILEIINSGLREFNNSALGKRPDVYSSLIKNENGDLIAGTIASSLKDLVYIHIVWVSESYRGKGLGSKLLKSTEEEARKRGAINMTLDTLSFQAEKFYEKIGFYRIGCAEKCFFGYDRIYMQKALS